MKDKMSSKRVCFKIDQICIAPASGFTKFEKEHVVHNPSEVGLSSLIPIQTLYCSCCQNEMDIKINHPEYYKNNSHLFK